MGIWSRIKSLFRLESVFSTMRGRFEQRIIESDGANTAKAVDGIDISYHGGSVKFRDKSSPFVVKMTIAIAILALIAGFYLSFSSSGTYLWAWYFSLVFSIVVLFIISVPRYLKVSDKHLEIHCVLEVTQIALSDIRRIHRIERYRVQTLLPIIGSYGFFGFYGYYFDAVHFRIVRIYAKKLSGMVVIQDIYNTRYYVSCSDPDLFVSTIKGQIAKIREEETILDKATGDDDDRDDDE